MSSSGRLTQIVRHNQDTFNKLGWYSLLLFVAGIGSFFLFGRGPLAAAITSDRNTKDTIGAIAGVLATNIVIAAYIISAFLEDQNSPAPGERGRPTPAPIAASSAASAGAGAESGSSHPASRGGKSHVE